MNKMSEYILFQCRTKQPFRVARGKSNWFWYDFGMIRQGDWNLREILDDEIVIEFDTNDESKSWEGITFTGINLYNAGIIFEIWEHQGKSPHLHVRNLPISHLSKDDLREFKKFFIKKFVPKDYLDCVDFSLCGKHLVALEWCEHWKGKYAVKKLLYKFNSKEDIQK